MEIGNKIKFARAFSRSFMSDMMRRPNVASSASGLRKKILDDLAREVRGEPGPVLFPSLRAFLRTEMNVKGYRAASGMGQWDAIISSITSAAGSYFTEREKAKSQARIAEIQLKAEQAKLAQAEAEAAREREALARSQGAPGVAVGSTARTSGTPGWLVPAAVVVTGAVATKVAGVW